MAAKKKKKVGKNTPQIVPGSGRTLTAEEGWRFFYVRKGDELLRSQLDDLGVMRSQAKALREAAAGLEEKAASLDRIAEEKQKRIMAEGELWDGKHEMFRKKLSLPEGAQVQHDASNDKFAVVMLPEGGK